MSRKKSVEEHDLMKKGTEVNPRAAKMRIAFHPQRHVLDTLVQLYSTLTDCGKTGNNVRGPELCLPGERSCTRRNRQGRP